MIFLVPANHWNLYVTAVRTSRSRLATLRVLPTFGLPVTSTAARALARAVGTSTTGAGGVTTGGVTTGGVTTGGVTTGGTGAGMTSPDATADPRLVPYPVALT